MSSSPKRKRLDCPSPSSSRSTGSSQTVNQAKEMTEWQEELGSVSKRDSYVLDHAMFTDCTFTIGEGETPTEVKCHRLYLAKSSPVFASMLYGELRKQDEVINLPDVSLQAFNAMLKYIYSGKVKLSKYSYEVVCGFLYVAKKYLLPKRLRAHLRAYLWHYIYPDNVWTAILFARNNDEPELEETAWQVVEKNTWKIIIHKSFQEIPRSMLLSLVRREHLSCTELHLFNACMRWARSEAGRQHLTPEPSVLREILAPIIPHIRFLTMDGDDFANKVESTHVLSSAEMLPITFHLLSANNKKQLPDTICNSKVSRTKPRHANFFVFGSPKNKLDELKIGDNMTPLYQNTHFTFANAQITARNRIIRLHGLKIPTQINISVPPNTRYEEHLTIFIFEPNSKKIIEKQEFKDNVAYNCIIDIPLPKIIELYSTADKIHSICIKIMFHVPGRYRSSRFFTSALDHINSERSYIYCGIDCCEIYDEASFEFIYCAIVAKNPLFRLANNLTV